MQTTSQIWIDNTPSKFKVLSGVALDGAIIGGGEDITVVGTANLNVGSVLLICYWNSVDSGHVESA